MTQTYKQNGEQKKRRTGQKIEHLIRQAEKRLERRLRTSFKKKTGKRVESSKKGRKIRQEKVRGAWGGLCKSHPLKKPLEKYNLEGTRKTGGNIVKMTNPSKGGEKWQPIWCKCSNFLDIWEKTTERPNGKKVLRKNFKRNLFSAERVMKHPNKPSR